MIRVAIIDYGSGNLRSAAKAFERVAGPQAVINVTSDVNSLQDATHIVLPGVGAFADCIRGLTAITGMRVALEKQVRQARKPFLGVCVGMQMLFERGHEHGMHEGLGWIEGEVVKIGNEEMRNQDKKIPQFLNSSILKIPHMGWNDLKLHVPAHPLLAGISSGDHVYFVHSYHARCNPEYILATTDYGEPITAIVAQGNVMGTQFHPEKSQVTGLQLIGNFLKMR